MANQPFDLIWLDLLIYVAIVPVVLFALVSVAVQFSARRQGRGRPGTRDLALPILGASVALFVIGQSAIRMLQLSAFALFLFGVAFFFSSNRVGRQSPLETAPGEVGAAKEQPRSDLWNLLKLALSLSLMAGSSLFVTAAILSLLAMPMLLVGVGMTCSLLFRFSDVPMLPRFRASRGLGGWALVLGVFAMATVQCFLTATFGGRNKAPIGPWSEVILGSGASWVAITGVLALGLWVRRCEPLVLVTVVLVVLATFAMTITLGSMVWPTVPTSL